MVASVNDTYFLDHLEHYMKKRGSIHKQATSHALYCLKLVGWCVVFSHWPLADIDPAPNYAIMFCHLPSPGFYRHSLLLFVTGAMASTALPITIITCKTGTHGEGQAISRYSRTMDFLSLSISPFRHKRVCFCLVSGKTSLSLTDWERRECASW